MSKKFKNDVFVNFESKKFRKGFFFYFQFLIFNGAYEKSKFYVNCMWKIHVRGGTTGY